MSRLSSNPVQLWLDTPIGSYVGSPLWGNNFETVLGKNSNDIPVRLNIILNKMRKDLKGDFHYVDNFEILEVGYESFLCVVAYQQQIIAVKEIDG